MKKVVFWLCTLYFMQHREEANVGEAPLAQSLDLLLTAIVKKQVIEEKILICLKCLVVGNHAVKYFRMETVLQFLISYQYNFLILKDVHLTWDEPADAKISNSPVDAGPRESLLMKLVSVVY